jgi:glycosyltransferase involved in cell wall biosynthesis
MLLFDATHTSHTRAQSGIQRVCRSLFAEFGREQPVAGICYDPYLASWRPLVSAELHHLLPGRSATGSRRAQWPLHRRVAGSARRLLGLTNELPMADALLCPELFSAAVGARLPELFASVRGPRVAIFYDAIGLKLPELTPPGTVARLPAYLRELRQFDGVAAISEDSAASLRDYWRWLGDSGVPPVQAIPLGVDPLPAVATAGAAPAIARILCVSTIEGRKNHLSLLEACEALWQGGLEFELQLFGLARADTAGTALARLAELQRRGRPVLHRATAADAELHAAYRECTFTVYPSLNEGFGLPVLESLQHGKPCVCLGTGALAELTHGGGCVALESVAAADLASAIRRLLQHPGDFAALAEAARQRPFKTWRDHARELTAWMKTLRCRH